MTDYLHQDELNLPSRPPAPRRRCRVCRSWLARDNDGDVCAPCAEMIPEQDFSNGERGRFAERYAQGVQVEVDPA